MMDTMTNQPEPDLAVMTVSDWRMALQHPHPDIITSRFIDRLIELSKALSMADRLCLWSLPQIQIGRSMALRLQWLMSIGVATCDDNSGTWRRTALGEAIMIAWSEGKAPSP